MVTITDSYTKDLEKIIEKQEKKITDLTRKLVRKEQKILPLAEYLFVSGYAVGDLNRLYRLYKKKNIAPAPKLTVTVDQYKETIRCLGNIFCSEDIEDLHLDETLVDVVACDTDFLV